MSADDYLRIKSVKGIKESALPAGRALSHAELRALGDACNDGTLLGIRDAALLALYVGGGLRRSEPCDLDRSDYTPATAEAPASVRIRHGKGNKERIAFLVDDNAQHVEKWLEYRPAVDGPLLFPIHRSGSFHLRRLDDDSVYRALMRRAQMAGIDTTVHCLRRTFITEALDQGHGIALVARQVGHATVQQTGRYYRENDRKLMRMARSMNLSIGGAE